MFSQSFYKRKDTLYPVALLLLTHIVLFPVLTNNFQYLWDDQWMVMNYYTEGGFSCKNLWAILTEFYHGQYGPINEYEFILLYSIFGYTPFPFHLYSLLLHMGNCLLVYFIIVKIFKVATWLKVKNEREIAFLTALVFSIHPMNVEAVAWISAVKIINYAFFYLAATYVYILFLEKKRIKYYLFALLLFTLSFLGKEQAVTFPVWLVLLYWFFNYDLKDKRIWFQLAPIFCLSVFFGLVTMWSQATVDSGVLSRHWSYPLWQRIVFACYSYTEYLFKIIFPFKLSYLYPFPTTIGDPLPNWLMAYPALMLFIPISLWRFLRQWPVAIGLLFFTVHICITLHIIPLSRFAIVADRYVYLAIIGASFIAAYYFVTFYSSIKKRYIKTLITVFFSGYLLYLCIYSHQRTHVWHDSDSLKKELRELLKQRNDYHLFHDEMIEDE